MSVAGPTEGYSTGRGGGLERQRVSLEESQPRAATAPEPANNHPSQDMQRPPSRATSTPTPLKGKGRKLEAMSMSSPELRAERKAKRDDFLARNLSHTSIGVRRVHADVQREAVAAVWAYEDMNFWGAKGIPGFREYLVSKFGSIMAGWRALDEDRNGRLSFYEFCNACRRMGYHGNLKMLWRELDQQKTGFVTISNLDPEVAEYVGKFKLALLRKYGDMLTAWQKGLDVNGSGRIEQAEVEACIKKLGLPLNAKSLYSMLKAQPGPHGLGLTLADFDPNAWMRWVTGDFKGLTLAKDKEFVEDIPGIGRRASVHQLLAGEATASGGVRQFRREQLEKRKQEANAEIQKNYSLRVGLHTIEGFRQALKARCGSILGAWREFLDIDGNGRITFGEFSCALSRLMFHGNVKGLWQQLDPQETGSITLAQLDAETDRVLTTFRERLREKYGNMLMAWLKCLDAQGTGVVNETQFVKACQNVEYPGNPKKLFALLQPDAGRRFMTLKDFDTQAYNALSRGDFRMISEQQAEDLPKKKPSEMTFFERQEAGFFYQIRRAWDAAKREEFSKALRMANAPTHFIDTTEEFESLLKRKFGSLMSAWRLCLDADLNGKLTFNEFCKVCRFLGYGGDIRELFHHYDRDKKGFIELRDLDPEADELVSAFLDSLNRQFGIIDVAWKKGFGKDPHDSIDEQELTQACHTLGYPHDPQKLFKCLQPMPGRNLITIWDVDPTCSRLRQRGDVAIVSSPKSAISAPSETLKKRQKGFKMQQRMSRSTLTQSQIGSQKLLIERIDMPQLLRLSLKRRYGSTPAAWRLALNPERTGVVSMRRFFQVCEECLLTGNLRSLWRELAGSQPSITFRSIDEDAQYCLDKARKLLMEKYGCLSAAWREGLDVHNAGFLNLDEFTNQCSKQGLQTESAKKLFKLMCNRPAQRCLEQRDMEALLIGLPASEQMSAWAGEDQGKGSPEATLSRPGTAPLTDLSQLPSPKARMDILLTELHKHDIVISTMENFKKMLIVKHGSLFAAWRHTLDADHNGIVTPADFANACRKLGVKAVSKLWDEFDANGNGQVSLYELDHELGAAFEALEEILIEKHGSTKEGWRQVFDVDKSLMVSKTRFIEGCQAIGLQTDAEKFFKQLLPEPGRNYLSYEDLWLNLNINDFKHTSGHADSISPLGSPKVRSGTRRRSRQLDADGERPSISQSPPRSRSP